MLRPSLALAALVVTAGHGHAEELTCQGPLAADTDHSRLVAAFGPANVMRETVYGPEGMEFRGTVVFARDPSRRLTVIWSDEKGRRRPAMVVTTGTGWTGPKSIRVGTPLAEVEKANGRPFVLYGFQWDYGGTVETWNGGALAALPGGCTFDPIFETDPKAPAAAVTSVASDSQFTSNSPVMRAAMPRIRSIALKYPQR